MPSPNHHLLSEEPLDDLLRVLEAREDSLEVSVDSSTGSAYLQVSNGKLTDASFGDLQGADAVWAILSLSEGNYLLEPRDPHSTGSFETTLAEIVQDRRASAKETELLRARPRPIVTSALERTDVEEPEGLSPLEKRLLTEVDGELCSIDLASQADEAPASVLRAIREIVARGLVSQVTSPTLALGTRISLSNLGRSDRSASRTIRSRISPQQFGSTLPSATGTFTDQGSTTSLQAKTTSLAQAKEPAPKKATPTQLSAPSTPLPDAPSVRQQSRKPSIINASKPPVGRWSQRAEARPRGTGYSSIPPPSLAEERILIASSRTALAPLPPTQTQDDDTHNSEEIRREVENAFGSARISPNSTLSGGSVRPGQSLRIEENFSVFPKAESAFPSKESKAASTKNSPGLGSTQFGGTPLSLNLPPPEESSLDEAVVEAAAGQLRESEMPVPSYRLDREALEQLGELNEAVISSRRPQFLSDAEALRSSTSPPGAHQPSSVPIPPAAGLPNTEVESSSFPAAANGPQSDEMPSLADVQAPGFAPLSQLGSFPETGPLSSNPSPGSVPHPNLLPGDDAPKRNSNLPTVGRYEVLSRLKRGGMGSVYMCRLTASAGFRRLFAMKVLHGHLAEQPEALDAFFHEARVLGGLHHHNIVAIADVGTPDQPFIVLDYVEGGSLAEIYRATREERDPRMIVSVILDALDGLAAAHNAKDERGKPLNLVHCDVTPHNLLVGIGGTCRVTDFGIARTGTIDPSQEIVQGKPGYLAPERIQRKPSDLRSDIFSLGVVLYSGLTGIEPFVDKTAEATMRNVLTKLPPAPSEVGLAPPFSLDQICLKALSKDPAERFQSAEEMASELRRVAGREGLLCSPSEVAHWVQESLGPTLAARRVASMRGAASAEDEQRWATIQPPVVDDKRESAATNSRDQTSGISESPPAPRSTAGERTVDLSKESQDALRADRPRGRTFAIYAVLMAIMATVVWVILRPESAPSFFRVVPVPSKDAASKDSDPQSVQDKNSQADTDSQTDSVSPPDEADDIDKIVLPKIVGGSGK